MSDVQEAVECKVLLVDDDEAIVSAYASCLDGAGIASRVCHDGWEAMDLIGQGFSPEVIVSDLRMPHLDGLGFAERLQKLSGLRPSLIFISGHADMSDSIQAIRLGASDMLLKPIDCASLVRSVKTCMFQRTQVTQEVRQGMPASAAPPAIAPVSNPVTARSNTLRKLRAVRRIRARVMSADLFADPCWDMMLDLYDAYRRDASLTTTVLAEEAHIPLTTAIRRLDTLAEHGLIARRQDGSDRRRTLVELSEVGIEALDKFFEQFSD